MREGSIIKKRVVLCMTAAAVCFCCINKIIQNDVSAENLYSDNGVRVEIENAETGTVYETELLNCTRTTKILNVNTTDKTIKKGLTLQGDFEVPAEEEEWIPSGTSKNMEYDKTISVKATLYMEYTTGVGWNGYDYYETYFLERVSGEWEIIDKTVTIYDKTYDVVCIDGDEAKEQVRNGIKISDDVYKFKNRTEFDKFVSSEDPTCYVAAAMECHIVRMSEPWIFRVSETIIENYQRWS